MRPLSATDAIAPAWNHASTLLLAPRSWRLLLKIGAIAFLTQLGGGGCNTTGVPPHQSVSHLPAMLPAIGAAWIAGLFAVALLSFAIGLALLYLGSRLQFVFFEVLLTRRTTIAPIWARYGTVTWRWIGLKILFVLAALVCLTPILVPAGIYLFKHVVTAPETPNPAFFIPAIILSVFALILGILILAAIWVWLSDFGLPSIALDDTSIGDTVRRVFHLVRADFGQCTLYLILRLFLSIASAFVAEVALALGALVALIPIGVGGGILWMALHNGGVFSKAVMITGWVVLALAFVTLIVCAAIMVMGYVHSFIKTYSLYFLGGRYPRLGEYLDQYQATLPSPSPLYPQTYPPYAPPHPS